MKTAEEKMDSLKKKLKSKEVEIERLKEIERYAKQLKSDFEHYRQLSQKEQQRTVNNANERLIEKMIPILLNFERATKHTPVQKATPEVQRVFKGYEMIYQMMRSVLENEGLQPIDALIGLPFDPFEQEVVEKVETDTAPEGSVLEIVEGGFKFRGKVLIPVKVKAAVTPQTVDSNDGTNLKTAPNPEKA